MNEGLFITVLSNVSCRFQGAAVSSSGSEDNESQSSGSEASSGSSSSSSLGGGGAVQRSSKPGRKPAKVEWEKDPELYGIRYATHSRYLPRFRYLPGPTQVGTGTLRQCWGFGTILKDQLVPVSRINTSGYGIRTRIWSTQHNLIFTIFKMIN